MTLLLNSVVLAIGASCLASFIGCSMALTGMLLGPSFRKAFRFLSILVLALPPFLIASVWMDGWSHYEPILGRTGWDLYSLTGCVLLIGCMLWPVTFWPTDAALAKVPCALMESDPFLRGYHCIRHLILPRIRSSVFFAFMIQAALAFNQFTIPTLLQVKVLPAEMWIHFNTTLKYGETFQLAWPWIVFPFFLWLFHRKPVIWQGSFQQEPRLKRLLNERLSKPWKAMCLVISLVTVMVSLCWPLLSILFQEETWSHLMPAVVAGKSVIWYSFAFAVFTALLCMAFGMGLSSLSWVMPVWLLFWLPGMITALALLLVFTLPEFSWLYPSMLIGVLALVLRYLGPAWSGARWVAHEENPDFKHAAQLMGAGWFHRWKTIHAPLRAPQLLASAYVVYLLALWDVETLILLYPPGAETLAIRAFNFLHYGHNAEIHAICLLSIGLGVLPWITLKLLTGSIALYKSLMQGTSNLSFLSPPPALLILIPLLPLFTGCGKDNPDSNNLGSQFFESVLTIGSKGNGIGQFSKPRSIAIDHQDQLYVADMTGRIQMFDSEGQFIRHWQMPEVDRGRPKGMCIDHEGHLVVIEPHYSRINHFDSKGELLRQWGAFGKEPGMLSLPRDAVVNSQGILFIGEYGSVERIQSFDLNTGTHLKTWGTPGNGTMQFNRPEGLGLDPATHTLLIADSCNHRVQIYDFSGQLLDVLGEPGTKSGQFSYPYDVAVDNQGRRFVCEFGNSRIQVFDQDNQWIETVSAPGNGPAELNNPWCIAFDSHHNLYIADSGNHRIQKWIAKPNAFNSAQDLVNMTLR